jgi:pilus assembly protein Flp/PilA
MHTVITRLLKDDRGTTAIEYALIAGLIALAIVAAVGGVGTALITKFTAIAAAL